MALLTFRDSVRKLVPWWASRQESIVGKLLYSIALHVDGAVDAVQASIKMRYPGLYSMDSLPLIGNERRIPRGPEETDEVYATRLPRWWDDHRQRGNSFAMLEQLYAYWSSANFPIHMVYRNGRHFDLDTLGIITRGNMVWDLDPEPEKWARWWLFYEWPDSVAWDGTWADSGTWDDGGVWDSTLTVAEVANIRTVPTEWNNAHSFGIIVLLYGDYELWDYPEGTWDDPGDWTDSGPAQLTIG